MSATRVALLVLLTFLPLSAFAAPATPPIILTASLEQPVCPEGQPVVLSLALYNGGMERLLIGGTASEASSFQITVTDGAGRPVSHTAFGDRVLTPPMSVGANAAVILDPGKTLRYRFNLAHLFDFSRIGDYTVSVKRSLRPWVLPRPALNTPRQETTLTAGPLKEHMMEADAAKSGPVALTPPPARRTFLYVANQYGGAVARLLVGEDGRPSPTLAAPVPAGRGVGLWPPHPTGASSMSATAASAPTTPSLSSALGLTANCRLCCRRRSRPRNSPASCSWTPKGAFCTL